MANSFGRLVRLCLAYLVVADHVHHGLHALVGAAGKAAGLRDVGGAVEAG